MPDISDSAVRGLAREILSRSEFPSHADPQSTLEQWMRRFFESIDKLGVIHDTAPILYWTIIAVSLIVGLGLLTHVIYTVYAALSAPEPSRRSLATAGGPDLKREAEELAAAGSFLEAAHRLMIASFRALAEHAVIDLRPDRPNRWIRAALRGSALAESLAAEIDSLVERTERQWFGDRQNDPEIYLQWQSAFERLSTWSR